MEFKKYYIFKENGILKGTNKDNYFAKIRNSFEIQSYENFRNFEELKQYFVKNYPNVILINKVY